MEPLFKHPWNLTTKEAGLLQKKLCEKLDLKPAPDILEKIKTLAAFDVSYTGKNITAAAVITSFPALEVVGRILIKKKPRNLFPYIPGYLSFREGPVLIELLKKIKHSVDILLFDGQGIAHPRKMGIAAHMGILFGMPSVGCAKNLLYGKYAEPGQAKGSRSYLKSPDGKTIGIVLRTRNSVKPVFVSPGNMIDADTAAEFVLRCCAGYRVPEPLRFAHHLTQKQ